MEEPVDFTELSFLAQRIFVIVEQELYRNSTTELHISKHTIAYLGVMSIPNVKIGLRELKQKGYIISKNSNSSIIRVGEEYAYKEER